MTKGVSENPGGHAFHGKPCAKCHASERLLNDAYCKGCRTIVNHDDYMKRKVRFAAIRAELRNPIARMREARDRKMKNRKARAVNGVP
jgi:hypothetical protein